MTMLAKTETTNELTSMIQLSSALFKGGGSFIPKHFRSEGEVLAALMTGRELGLQPMASLRGIFVVNGKPGLDYSVQVALLKKHGYRIEWHQQDADLADCTLHAPDGTGFRKSYGRKDAELAKLWGSSDPWRKHPATMLCARLIGFMCRSFAAEIFSGIYGVDELREIESAMADAPPRAFEKKTFPQTTAIEPPKKPALKKETRVVEREESALFDDLVDVETHEDMDVFIDRYRDELVFMNDEEKKLITPTLKEALKKAGLTLKYFRSRLEEAPQEEPPVDEWEQEAAEEAAAIASEARAPSAPKNTASRRTQANRARLPANFNSPQDDDESYLSSITDDY